MSLTLLQKLILETQIDTFKYNYTATKKQAKARDTIGKTDAHEWYAKAEIYAKMAQKLEELLDKETEEHRL